MKFTLNPLKKLMDNLRYPKKFLLIFLVFIIPSIITVSFSLNNIQKNIGIAQNEKLGLEGTLKLQTIIQKIQQHRGLSSTYLGGNTEVLTNLNSLKEEIEVSITNFEQYLQSSNLLLANLDEEWDKVKNQWKEIDITKLNAADSYNSHTEMISNLISIGTLIADTTYLSLDGERNRHHLVKMITEDLIQSAEYMGQGRARGSNILAGKKMTEEEKLELIYLSKIMTENIQRVQMSMEIVLNNNEEFKEQITNQYILAMDYANNFSALIFKELIGKDDNFTYNSNEYYAYGTSAIDSLYLLISYNAELLDSLLDNHIEELTSQRNIILFVIILTSFFAIVLFNGFYHSVKDSITRISESMVKISNGNLMERIQLETKDEMKEIELSINNMIHSFQQLIKSNQELSLELSGSAEELSTSASESTKAFDHIAQIYQTITTDADEQSNTVAKVNDSIQSMALHIKEVSSRSENMLQMFEHAAAKTSDGVQMVNDVHSSMDDIHITVLQTAKVIKNLDDSSNKIDNIVSLITNISNQTNLLALNATIEAARAGEHGKGFAVVAQEVSKLAEQSRQSAEQISALIHQIQEETEEAVQSMEKGTEKVAVGLGKVTEVSKVFQYINTDIKNVKDIVVTLTNAVGKITAESGEITKAMMSVKQAAENSASAIQESSAASEQQLAAMEEITASAESLAVMADKLQELINKFKV